MFSLALLLLTRPVRANQKDSYFLHSLTSHVQDVLGIFGGQKFIHTHPDEIALGAKVLYLLLTTALGARTLGEEYVDILYVNRKGKKFPGSLRRLVFIALYALVPYVVTRVVRKLKSQGETSKSWLSRTFQSYPKLLDTVLNVHVALFYFQGLFYSLSKRAVGMRYVFGHNKDPEKLLRTGNYSLLGGIMLLQFAVKLLLKIQNATSQDDLQERDVATPLGVFTEVKQLESVQTSIDSDQKLALRLNIDLLDPKQLPYLPESSRSCMLCLSPMVNPAAANCGHIFCWSCIVDWIRDHPECPLCRQVCLEQNLLPLC